MKKHFLLAALLITSLVQARAGSVETRFTQDVETEKPALDLFNLDASYVFESQISRGNVNFGDQDAFHVQHGIRASLPPFRASLSPRRRRLTAASISADGSRQFRINCKASPAIIGIDYMVGKDLGAFLQLRPGFYTDRTFDGDSFDMPITLGRLWVLQEKTPLLLTGVNARVPSRRISRAAAGGIDLVSERAMERARDFAGAAHHLHAEQKYRLSGSAVSSLAGPIAPSKATRFVPRRLSNAQVDYSEYRGGVGFDFKCGRATSLCLSRAVTLSNAVSTSSARVSTTKLILRPTFARR